jgi:hypothetical protein
MLPNPDTFSVILIRRLDGKQEASFAYRACMVRSTVAHLLVMCNVAGIAWFDMPTRGEAVKILNEAKQIWL